MTSSVSHCCTIYCLMEVQSNSAMKREVQCKALIKVGGGQPHCRDKQSVSVLHKPCFCISAFEALSAVFLGF